MNKYLVIIKTKQECVHALIIEAENFAKAEEKILLFPTLKNIIQITLAS